ncbi:MAG: hypothetical protein EPN97_11275 [Alphaproteobacteria bacterium]|nr:MAG: hypothetical protein EPN97_11275 [Alphaproteobacteria bacterium]
MTAFFRAALLILIMIPLAAAPAGGTRYKPHSKPNLADPSYTACKTDNECLIVRPACSAPLAVNAHRFKEVDAWFEYMRPFYKCADWLSQLDVKKKACVKNRCTVELAQAVPPEPDNSPQAKDPNYCDTDSECTVVLGDCCVKSFVNTKNAPRMRAEIKAKEHLANCFFPDRRHVQNLRCENHKCTAELEVPSELPDPTHSLKDKCEQ